jgi:hypothetical protein
MKTDKNYDSQLRKVDVIYSGKALRKFEDKLLTKGRGNAMWRSFDKQQQEALGFANVAGGITIPAAATWLSQSWDSSATYIAGNGTQALPLSFVQLSGVVYAIPGLVASTPGTPPPGGVWVIQPPGPGMNAWQVNPNAKMSVWANPTLGFPLPPTAAVDVVDSAWAIPDTQVQSTTAAQFYIPAPGIGFMIGTPATTFSSLQFNLAGTWTTAATFTAATYLPVFLDGLTWRILASGTTRNTMTIYRSRQTIQS